MVSPTMFKCNASSWLFSEASHSHFYSSSASMLWSRCWTCLLLIYALLLVFSVTGTASPVRDLGESTVKGDEALPGARMLNADDYSLEVDTDEIEHVLEYRKELGISEFTLSNTGSEPLHIRLKTTDDDFQSRDPIQSVLPTNPFQDLDEIIKEVLNNEAEKGNNIRFMVLGLKAGSEKMGGVAEDPSNESVTSSRRLRSVSGRRLTELTSEEVLAIVCGDNRNQATIVSDEEWVIQVLVEFRTNDLPNITDVKKREMLAACIGQYIESGALVEPDYLVQADLLPVDFDADTSDIDKTTDRIVNEAVDTDSWRWPNDHLLRYTWGMFQTQCPAAWGWITGEEAEEKDRPLVCVVDTGVDYFHQDLRENMWVNQKELNGLPGVDDDGNGYVDDYYGWNAITSDGFPMDDHSHGTHVSGTIGAKGNNSFGIVGVNWAPKIIACKFLNSKGHGFLSDAYRCIDYCLANGAQVSNHSWGWNGNPSYSLSLIFQRAQRANHLVVASAGNYGMDIDKLAHYPAAYRHNNIISVAALQQHGRGITFFSDYGLEGVDLAAPGESIVSYGINGRLLSWSGTSMAAPHVTGAISLLLSHKPEMHYFETKALILSTVQKNAELEAVVRWGGSLDVYGAVQELMIGSMWIQTKPEDQEFRLEASESKTVVWKFLPLLNGIYTAKVDIEAEKFVKFNNLGEFLNVPPIPIRVLIGRPAPTVPPPPPPPPPPPFKIFMMEMKRMIEGDADSSSPTSTSTASPSSTSSTTSSTSAASSIRKEGPMVASLMVAVASVIFSLW